MRLIAVYPSRPYDRAIAVVCPVCGTRDEWAYFRDLRPAYLAETLSSRGEMGPVCSGGCGAFMVREPVALVRSQPVVYYQIPYIPPEVRSWFRAAEEAEARLYGER